MVQKIKEHAAMLGNVHPSLKEDLLFVEKKWLSDVNAIWEYCEDRNCIRKDDRAGTVEGYSSDRLLDPVACRLRAGGILQWL